MEVVREYNCYNFNDEWYLIEMLLDIDPCEISFENFVVPEDGVAESDWQTAFLEQYLNENGTEKICELYDVPERPMPFSRIAFFVYKVDANILQTPFGEFRLTADNTVPSRLQSLIEIDEDYM